MEALNNQFQECLSERIKIDSEPASEAHIEVRRILEGDATLKSWGVDTILIGSYARKVSIYPCGDVDVFVKLPQCESSDPHEVFIAVKDALRGEYKDRVKEQRRSLTVTGFSNGLSVDAVPAVRDGDRWKIPQADSEGRKNSWEATDPERLTELTQKANGSSPQVNGTGSYVPVVKLVRQVREHHLGEDKPGGLYFELLTYWAFRSGLTGASYAELLAQALDKLATHLESGAVVVDPAMGTGFTPNPSPELVARAAMVFRSLAKDAEAALSLEKCPAAAAWRRILGRNSRGPVFLVPPGCDESGKALAAVTLNRDRGTDEARPYA